MYLSIGVISSERDYQRPHSRFEESMLHWSCGPASITMNNKKLRLHWMQRLHTCSKFESMNSNLVVFAAVHIAQENALLGNLSCSASSHASCDAMVWERSSTCNSRAARTFSHWFWIHFVISWHLILRCTNLFLWRKWRVREWQRRLEVAPCTCNIQ